MPAKAEMHRVVAQLQQGYMGHARLVYSISSYYYSQPMGPEKSTMSNLLQFGMSNLLMQAPPVPPRPHGPKATGDEADRSSMHGLHPVAVH